MNGSEGRGQAEPGKGEGSGKSLERKPGKTHKQSTENQRLSDRSCTPRRPSVKEAKDGDISGSPGVSPSDDPPGIFSNTLIG